MISQRSDFILTKEFICSTRSPRSLEIFSMFVLNTDAIVVMIVDFEQV